MPDDIAEVTPQGPDGAQPDDTALEDYQFQEDVQEEGVGEDAQVADEVLPEVAPEPTAAELMTQAEERAFQRMASWSGRRDKELLDAVGNMINQRLPQAAQQPVTPSDAATILDNPDAWVAQKIREMTPGVLTQEINRVTTAERNYNAALIQQAGQLMDGDPLFNDKTFGGEVIAEIQKEFGTVNKGIPPDINARLLIGNAVANIYRRKSGEKTNALAGNTGAKGGVGGVKAGTTPVLTKGKVIKLSPDAKRLADRWGYKEEDLQRVFKEA
ncbi:MAG: hypothetical protein Q7K21_00225 [Elusimicrobiota bacterium]|nr:hypothetical protein [Elusimicrobiota bacterium]